MYADADPSGWAKVVGAVDLHAVEGGTHPTVGCRLAVTDRCGGIRDDDLARVFAIGWRGLSLIELAKP